jgi:hypothetical protein
VLLVVSCVEGFGSVLEGGIGLVCLHDFGGEEQEYPYTVRC